jgi:guanyl-specific ribonuclease Sa
VVNRLGQIDNINTVIASCHAVKTVGQFYSGGGFGNLGNGAGQPTVMVLPDNVGYREYDIKPYKDDPGRGKKRIVVGGGNYYYTGDHYETFTRFRP